MCALLLCVNGHASELRLTGYQRSDGAITTYYGGDTIDPYFASKALLSASDIGLDARAAARRWIRWLLPRQLKSGQFERYCLVRGRFVGCRQADADDALLATWMELLVRFSPPEGMPPAWKRSFDMSSRYLDGLRDKRLGVFNVASDLPVALMMDNAEISSAFKAVARYAQATHDKEAAEQWTLKAQQLDRDILQVFWQPGRGFAVSTQARDKTEFYPDTVAQIFPILSGIVPDNERASARYHAWMKQHRFVWLQMPETDYPWGLVALVADKMGDADAITCWRVRATQFRHGTHWNVLEEALYQAFESRLTPEQAVAPVPGGLRCR
ncbi:hypothetical protein CupriaWKF_24500 [Cupriavidus sp. WKF15]|uniref:MGH1-like glycoside hydrolase domain-containing protein n=1 Tax=Cupriavidus sp. WKF15 TaxID=3032282 RepID=UPI0023E159BE|nr:hypothetical protein [Cupriavidus sp. WKF15]WER47977.1 hypothetical protein CupriaWKF_24500 [Cupriavidus sp. WKF15]